MNEEDRQGSMSSSPRTNPGDETIIVQIEENDNSRGLLEFVQTEITVDETVGSITLEVVRTSGTFGRVGVDFTVSGVTATGGGTDFSPDSGSLEFEEDVSSQTITVDIINDSEAEFDEVKKTYKQLNEYSVKDLFFLTVIHYITAQPSKWSHCG